MELKEKKLIVNETNKNDIIKILGPPSVESKFDNEVLFFIERKITNSSTFRIGKQVITTNNVLVIEIDSYGILKKKDFYDLTKMNDLKFSENKTSLSNLLSTEGGPKILMMSFLLVSLSISFFSFNSNL